MFAGDRNEQINEGDDNAKRDTEKKNVKRAGHYDTKANKKEPEACPGTGFLCKLKQGKNKSRKQYQGPQGQKGIMVHMIKLNLFHVMDKGRYTAL